MQRPPIADRDIKPRVDFIGIGASRCGTTWVAACLREHPEICFSTEKETHFFDREYNRRRGFSFYAAYFKDCAQEKIVGELSPSYFLFPEVGEDISQYYPDAKLFMIVREPVARALSHANYEFRRTGRVIDLGLLLQQDEQHQLIQNGRYYTHLRAFLKDRDISDIHIIVYEDLVADSGRELGRLYHFLGVDDSFVPPSLHLEINASRNKAYRVPFFNRIVSWRKRLKRTRGGSYCVRTLKAIGMNTLIQKMVRWNRADTATVRDLPVSDTTKQALREYYKDDVALLTEQTELDLSRWNY